MDVSKYRNPELAEAKAALDAAKAAYEAVVARVQAECPHAQVVEMPGSYGIMFTHHARRICAACGYEEECGSVDWPWGGVVTINNKAVEDQYGTKPKLNSDFVHKINPSNERPFYACRP